MKSTEQKNRHAQMRARAGTPPNATEPCSSSNGLTTNASLIFRLAKQARGAWAYEQTSCSAGKFKAQKNNNRYGDCQILLQLDYEKMGYPNDSPPQLSTGLHEPSPMVPPPTLVPPSLTSQPSNGEHPQPLVTITSSERSKTSTVGRLKLSLSLSLSLSKTHPFPCATQTTL